MTKQFCDRCKGELKAPDKLEVVWAGVVREHSFPADTSLPFVGQGVVAGAIYPQSIPRQVGYQSSVGPLTRLELCQGCLAEVRQEIKDVVGKN